jgi:hypothetical protein
VCSCLLFVGCTAKKEIQVEAKVPKKEYVADLKEIPQDASFYSKNIDKNISVFFR